jgi:hypothetical protein
MEAFREQRDEPRPEKRTRASSAVSDDRIVAALRENGFNVSATATALDVSRTWLFTRMDACDRIRKAGELGADEISRCRDECAGDIDAMVVRLEGLQARAQAAYDTAGDTMRRAGPPRVAATCWNPASWTVHKSDEQSIVPFGAAVSADFYSD